MDPGFRGDGEKILYPKPPKVAGIIVAIGVADHKMNDQVCGFVGTLESKKWLRNGSE